MATATGAVRPKRTLWYGGFGAGARSARAPSLLLPATPPGPRRLWAARGTAAGSLPQPQERPSLARLCLTLGLAALHASEQWPRRGRPVKPAPSKRREKNAHAPSPARQQPRAPDAPPPARPSAHARMLARGSASVPPLHALIPGYTYCLTRGLRTRAAELFRVDLAAPPARS